MPLSIICLYIPGGRATPYVLADYVRGFEAAGHNVQVLPIGDLVDAAREGHLEQYIRWIVDRTRPSFVFSYDYWPFYPCTDGTRVSLSPFDPPLSGPVRSIFHMAGIPTVSIFGDDPFVAFGSLESPTGYFEIPLQADIHMSFIWSPVSASRFKSEGYSRSCFLPLACNPSRFVKSMNNSAQAETVFIGSYTQRRMQYLRSLEERGIDIYGDAAWGDQASGNLHYRGPVDYDSTLFPLYAAAKCTVDVLAADSYWMSQRPFDVWGCGGFLLQERVPKMDDVFCIQDYPVVFDSPAQLAERIDYFSSRPKERRRLSRELQVDVLRNHTYSQRVDELLSQLRQREFIRDDLPGRQARRR